MTTESEMSDAERAVSQVFGTYTAREILSIEWLKVWEFEVPEQGQIIIKAERRPPGVVWAGGTTAYFDHIALREGQYDQLKKAFDPLS